MATDIKKRHPLASKYLEKMQVYFSSGLYKEGHRAQADVPAGICSTNSTSTTMKSSP
jgi:hypothetical protein